MKDYKIYINALRKCAKEHENDRTFKDILLYLIYVEILLICWKS